jgi:DNA-binding XRE family transcriptional regulator
MPDTYDAGVPPRPQPDHTEPWAGEEAWPNGVPAEVVTAATGEIGQRLAMAVDEQGLRLRDLAKVSGVSTGTISHLIRGKYPPTIETVIRLEAALGVGLWPASPPEPPDTPRP